MQSQNNRATTKNNGHGIPQRTLKLDRGQRFHDQIPFPCKSVPVSSTTVQAFPLLAWVSDSFLIARCHQRGILAGTGLPSLQRSRCSSRQSKACLLGKRECGGGSVNPGHDDARLVDSGTVVQVRAQALTQ